jgi:hypothetical protein
MTPGKIPSEDNPYALGAAFEAASLLPLGLEGAIAGSLGRAAAGAAEKGTAELAARVAAETAIKPGSFSIVDWSGYPEFLPRPNDPFRLLQGEECKTARDAANRVNRAIRNSDPAAYEGMQIHEFHPVKFGGHPTDPANKIVLPVEQHRPLNGWWRSKQWSLERGDSK